jgi:hypothetical protein
MNSLAAALFLFFTEVSVSVNWFTEINFNNPLFSPKFAQQ